MQGVSKAPSDEGAVTGHTCPVTEGEITQHYNNTLTTNLNRILCIFFHGIESYVFYLLICCVISPLAL